MNCEQTKSAKRQNRGRERDCGNWIQISGRLKTVGFETRASAVRLNLSQYHNHVSIITIMCKCIICFNVKLSGCISTHFISISISWLSPAVWLYRWCVCFQYILCLLFATCFALQACGAVRETARLREDAVHFAALCPYRRRQCKTTAILNMCYKGAASNKVCFKLFLKNIYRTGFPHVCRKYVPKLRAIKNKFAVVLSENPQ